MLYQWLFGNRDILVPYFDFFAVDHGQHDSPVLAEIYRLRYEVYCLECHFLEPDAYDEGKESDEYDDCSAHFAASTDYGQMVGTVRLVQPTAQQIHPFEHHCGVFDGFEMPPREQVGEVSRLVVRKTHRRRRGDSMQGVSRDFLDQKTASIQPRTGKEQRSNSPLLLLGLYREMYRYSRRNGIRYWYAAMERSLARSLDKMGFGFVPIGPQVDYYGPVTPYMVDLDQLERRLRQENKFLAAWFHGESIPFHIVAKTVWASLSLRRTGKK